MPFQIHVLLPNDVVRFTCPSFGHLSDNYTILHTPTSVRGVSGSELLALQHLVIRLELIQRVFQRLTEESAPGPRAELRIPHSYPKGSKMVVLSKRPRGETCGGFLAPFVWKGGCAHVRTPSGLAANQFWISETRATSIRARAPTISSGDKMPLCMPAAQPGLDVLSQPVLVPWLRRKAELPRTSSRNMNDALCMKHPKALICVLFLRLDMPFRP